MYRHFPVFLGSEDFVWCSAQEEKYEFNRYGQAHFEEKDGIYYIEIPVPGWKKDDINVTIDRDVLFVKGKKENSRILKELSSDFVVKDADLKKVEANLEDGILYIKVYKIKEKQPIKVEIK